jgi:DNA-binding NarL/FixJ family response regulator
MKREPKVININHNPAFRMDPTLTSEEAIVLRALAAGKTDKQVCNELRMAPDTFLRMMRDVREKTCTPNNLSLREWARLQMKGVDQRIDKQERFARPA